ncbi:MAG: hypothetical protein GY820_21495 [Gammaproteobacteria bacterium]|nr:hypothetical protein [Gammaproteobacteria bacterium]
MDGWTESTWQDGAKPANSRNLTHGVTALNARSKRARVDISAVVRYFAV